MEAVCTTAPETGNGIPIRHIVYESERKNQENSRQQVGKDGSIGPHSRHRVQLALFLYRIACMLVALAIILCILSFLVF